MKKRLIVLIAFFACNSTFAQFGVGPDVGYKIFGKGGIMNNPVFGISFVNHLGDGDIQFYSAYTLSIPKSYKYTTLASAYDMFSSPSPFVSVDITTRYTNMYFDVGAGKIFNGDYDDGGFVAFGGINAVMSRYKTTIGNYDKDNYYLDESNYSKGMYMGYGIKAGVGYLLRFGSLGLYPYGDATFMVFNSEDGAIPTYFSIGARLMFFK